MKKIICIFLTLLLLAGSLVSCDTKEMTTTTTTATPGIPLDYIEKQGFTGVVNEIISENNTEMMLSVEVCEAYTDALGEKVTVVCNKTEHFYVIKNDEILVRTEKITDNSDGISPKLINASSIQVVRTANGRQMYSNSFLSYYKVPLVGDISILKSFPDITDDTLTHKLTTETWTNDLCRVVKIENGIVYLAGIYEEVVSAAIIGIPRFNFANGDYIRISCNRLYSVDDTWYSIAYAKDVSSITIESIETVKEIYKKNYMDIYFPADKPVIYLYPEEETEVSVKVNIDGELTCTYPEHGEEGWQDFTAKPDGTLVSPDGREYYCLYWEGLGNIKPDFSSGFCVKGEDTAEFLADVLEKIGLTPREANEFIIYWLPILQENEYNLISFQGDNYTSAAELEITPTPDSILRVFMAAKPLSAPAEISPQEFAGFERSGFTVVEWGGGIIE